MASANNILAQVVPPATTETLLYSATKNFKGYLQELVVCNRSSTQQSFRVSVSLLGAATSTKDYLLYDLPIFPNNTLTFELGLTLNAFDAVRVYASSADLTFTIFGSQS